MSLDLLIVDETRPWSASADDDDLDHLWCCDRDVALCGANITNATDWLGAGDMPDECVVCHDLEDQICPRCGE